MGESYESLGLGGVLWEIRHGFFAQIAVTKV